MTFWNKPRLTGSGSSSDSASERTLSRLFRRDTGMTFPQSRAQLRLQHATILLAAGGTVTGAATASGYTNASAFIAAFRDAFGITPATYRHETVLPRTGPTAFSADAREEDAQKLRCPVCAYLLPSNHDVLADRETRRVHEAVLAA